jgi:hypothetical protein
MRPLSRRPDNARRAAAMSVLAGVAPLAHTLSMKFPGIKGWDWWPALIGAVVLGIVPLFGQLAIIVLTFVGAYFLIEAKFDWREAIEPTQQTLAAPDEKPGRLRHCVNADVPAYGNMQDRADKGLQWLHTHKKEYVGALR